MNTLKCEVIRDLLPLYVDEICSGESKRLVSEHLESCNECKRLYEKMKISVVSCRSDGELDTKKAFNSVWKRALGIIVTLAIVIGCCSVNLLAAFEGGKATAISLTATLIYIIGMGAFTFITRHIYPFAKFSFVFSLLTFLSAVFSTICRLTKAGGFISLFLSFLSAVPFYGLRITLDWTKTYMAASMISLVWLIFAGLNWRKIQKNSK